MAMANRYVDDVLIGAPYQISNDLLTSLNIQVVVAGKLKQDDIMEEYAHIDPFEIPKEKGIY